MIVKDNNIFYLNTKNTTYAFRIMPSRHLEHLYYGEIINEINEDALIEKNEFICGNLISYSKEFPNLALENTCLEFSGLGKGDVRTPAIEMESADGNMTTDFKYISYEIFEKKEELQNLPSSYGDAKQLTITLKEAESDIEVKLVYSVFEETDVITRSVKVCNKSNDSITLKRLMSLMLDFDESEFDFIHFNGAWAREMNISRQKCTQGQIVNSSLCGTSSSRSNPFVIVAEENAAEDYGKCFGFNLIYSGNHTEICEVNSFGKLRFTTGINNVGFSMEVKPGEDFQAPEAVMTFSKNGLNGMSHNMHRFVRENIVRGEWKYKDKPILLNSWESVYFNFNENSILRMAKSAKDAGIELFVMDDGWFGNRNDDKSSLGDWIVNEKKFPSGLGKLVEKINGIGLSFGIWIEIEMVNEDSNLYRQHREWVVKNPNRSHSEGRNQMILDLTRDDVRNYLISSVSDLLNTANIEYVKWDMNRIFTDYFSTNVDGKQSEFLHKYIIGLYDIMNTITKKFPKVLFEGCSAGGNRFDLGILCYMPQIWASDNTDALCRAKIQTGYSYGYPMSVISAHVSGCPNHQTLRNTDITTRFNVACYGILGYECNLSELNKEEYEEVVEQIKLYKELRHTLQNGKFYRIKSGESNAYKKGIYKWICVNDEKTEAIGMILQEQVVSNSPYEKFVSKGLNDDYLYEFKNRKLKYNIKKFGDLINTVAPIRIKQDSVIHNAVAKWIKMDGENEEYVVTGSLLNYAGIKLKQGFSATGYNENVRYFQDGASRLYIIKKID